MSLTSSSNRSGTRLTKRGYRSGMTLISGGGSSNWSSSAPYDEPSNLYLFDSTDQASATTIRDVMGGGLDLNLNQSGTPTMQWTGSGDALGLDMNCPAERSIQSVDTTNDYLVRTSSVYPFTLMSNGQRVLLSTTGTLPSPLLTNTAYYARVVSSAQISLHPTGADAINNANKIDITDVGSGTHTVLPRNLSNWWRASQDNTFIHDKLTVYVWATINDPRDICDFLAVTKNSYDDHRWKMEVGHSLHYGLRIFDADNSGYDYWSNLRPGILPCYASGANQGDEYRTKLYLTYRNNGTKTNTSLVAGQTYLFVFAYEKFANFSSRIKRGFAKLGDAAGFDYEGTGLLTEDKNKRYWRDEWSSLTMNDLYNATSTLQSCSQHDSSAGPGEQSDVTYHKIVYYANQFKSAAHDAAMFTAGLDKTDYTL